VEVTKASDNEKGVGSMRLIILVVLTVIVSHLAGGAVAAQQVAAPPADRVSYPDASQPRLVEMDFCQFESIRPVLYEAGRPFTAVIELNGAREKDSPMFERDATVLDKTGWPPDEVSPGFIWSTDEYSELACTTRWHIGTRPDAPPIVARFHWHPVRGWYLLEVDREYGHFEIHDSRTVHDMELAAQDGASRSGENRGPGYIARIDFCQFEVSDAVRAAGRAFTAEIAFNVDKTGTPTAITELSGPTTGQAHGMASWAAAPAELAICLKSWRIPVLPEQRVKARFTWTPDHGWDTLDVQAWASAELYRIHATRHPGRPVREVAAAAPGPFLLSAGDIVYDSVSASGGGTARTAPLAWTASNRAAAYDVYRNGQRLAIGVTALTFRDHRNLQPGHTYVYVVQARNAAGTYASDHAVVEVPVGGDASRRE
jgi:hypothetical protein